MKKLLLQSAIAALIGAGGLAAAATSASADIACNRRGDCWHTTEHYNYQPTFGITVHDDKWRWRGHRNHWREHDGRGYWRNGLWVTF
jgi:hypothetical protein